MERAMKRAFLTIIFPAMLGLVLACGTTPAAAPMSPTATVAITAAVSLTPAPITPGENATVAPTNTPTPVVRLTPEPTSGPSATPPAATAAIPPSPAADLAKQPADTPDSTSEPKPEPTADPSMVQADIVEVILPGIHISAGVTVVWSNLDEAGHTATSGQDGVSTSIGDISWDSGGLDMGEAFSMTFSQPGVFPYTCRFHPWMNATVTVIPSSGGASGASGGSSGSGDSGY